VSPYTKRAGVAESEHPLGEEEPAPSPLGDASPSLASLLAPAPWVVPASSLLPVPLEPLDAWDPLDPLAPPELLAAPELPTPLDEEPLDPLEAPAPLEEPPLDPLAVPEEPPLVVPEPLELPPPPELPPEPVPVAASDDSMQAPIE
jgi:hypothetical protein